MFDGSSIAGWKAINESDMVLMLDPRQRRACGSVLCAEVPPRILVCDIHLSQATGDSAISR